MSPRAGLSKDIRCHVRHYSMIADHQIKNHATNEMAVSLVITEGHFYLGVGWWRYVWVNILILITPKHNSLFTGQMFVSLPAWPIHTCNMDLRWLLISCVFMSSLFTVECLMFMSIFKLASWVHLTLAVFKFGECHVWSSIFVCKHYIYQVSEFKEPCETRVI